MITEIRVLVGNVVGVEAEVDGAEEVHLIVS